MESVILIRGKIHSDGSHTHSLSLDPEVGLSNVTVPRGVLYEGRGRSWMPPQLFFRKAYSNSETTSIAYSDVLTVFSLTPSAVSVVGKHSGSLPHWF